MAKRRARGEGSIFQERSGMWCAQITLSDGTRKRKRSKKQGVVKDWLLEQRKALQDNIFIANENITFAHFLDRFMSDIAAHTLKPTTIDGYRVIVENHVKPTIGHFNLNAIQPHHLQALYTAKLDQGLSAKTVRHIHAFIRRSLNEAIKWGLLVRNPCDMVTPPKPKKKTPLTFTEEQAKFFLEAVREHRWYPIYAIALSVGLRRSEILGLHWEDVNLQKGTASIRYGVTSVRGKTILETPKTKSSKRTVTLPEFVIQALKEHQKKEEKSEGLVFATSVGTPISPRNLLRHYYKVLDQTDVPRIRFHDLRHTAATLLLKKNVHPKVVQELLGHSSITVTLDTYSHVLPGIQQEAANQMDDIFQV